ncbi:hypothetical protein HW115_14725 [Verrucomicrobiaceae bacterium N1E253]|uniref:Uncharacterized protein n=1 Tax=Oceaniferula marina TaxID=2748318 RepID=A0A851GP23_9BACT|nr:hypothetical protein [Oceaniferula marina]NWK56875.1 hypothetical protein [Oceaniferula marina]
MFNANLPASEYIKQGVLLVVVIAVALFGIKSCRKYQKQRQLVIELSNHASESAAYEQFYAESAQQNLLKAMSEIHQASLLGLTPNEVLDKVMQKEKGFFADEESGSVPIREKLIRDTLLSNYDHCHKLGIFDDDINLDSLAAGELPTITKGPSANETAVIRNIIDASILPGVEKLLPNLVISPPRDEKATDTDTHFAKARAKQLLQSLAEASLIEHKDYKKVMEHFEARQNKLPPIQPEAAPSSSLSKERSPSP